MATPKQMPKLTPKGKGTKIVTGGATTVKIKTNSGYKHPSK